MSQTTYRVALFGELLMRLTTPRHERFAQAETYDVAFTGGEANTGALLAQLGLDASLVTKVPENELGQACVNHMRRFGMDTTYVQFGGPRLGSLYVEIGAAQRATKVIYDRTGSSFSQLRVGDVPWEVILRRANWLHFTGTAPALSSQLTDLTLQGCQTAQRMGVTVSCDLNYRSALWSIDDARTTMQRIIAHVDILIANEEHARLILGAPAARLDEAHNLFNPHRYTEMLQWLRVHFGLSHAALTIRAGNTSDETTVTAVVDDGHQCCASRTYSVRIVDRIGAGDAFSAGLIYGLSQAWDTQPAVEFAAAASCLKHSVHGDFCIATLQEIQKLAESGSDGRVLR